MIVSVVCTGDQTLYPGTANRAFSIVLLRQLPFVFFQPLLSALLKYFIQASI